VLLLGSSPANKFNDTDEMPMNNKGPDENLMQFISLLGLLYIIMHVYQYHDKNRDVQKIVSKEYK
jgi:hypothetical protein